MTWILFVVGAVVFWGMYGPALHQGQVLLGNPWRALLCVGVAYFLVGILVPIIGLSYEGALGGFNTSGSLWATLGGALGALGAVCIIWAFRAGGVPAYVMPLVFAGAPLVNVIVSMAMHPPKTAPNPLLYLGFVLAAAGAGMVLYYKPVSQKRTPHQEHRDSPRRCRHRVRRPRRSEARRLRSAFRSRNSLWSLSDAIEVSRGAHEDLALGDGR